MLAVKAVDVYAAARQRLTIFPHPWQKIAKQITIFERAGC